MSTIEPHAFRLKDGRRGVIRTAIWTDATRLLSHRQHIWETANQTSVTDPAESAATTTTEVERIESHGRDADKLFLVAETSGIGDELAGSLLIRAGNRRRIAHTADFGISVHESVRDQGVGRELIAVMLNWARAHPTIEKVTLGVFANNPRAIHLYARMGFQEEGRRARYFKFGPGQYVDDIQMMQWVK